jgi:branched-chain amino acid transport system permease protein
MKISAFWVFAAVILAGGVAAATVVENEYYFFAGYTILQAIIMAIAWNVLGGFTGYINFGSAGFFGLGAYTSVALHTAFEPPLLVLIVAAAAVSGLLGLGAGYLTLRLKGVYFAIATLAMAIVLETLMINWDYVGGATGAYILTPESAYFFETFIGFLFVVMLVLAIGAAAIARHLNSSRIGRGLAAIRDEETAAECTGVPTLRLKLVSTTIMGALMGVAGAPFPFLITFVEPVSAFNLLIAVNAIAMPMIGGTATWFGPIVGAVLLGSVQEWTKVTISSEWNLLIVGVMLVGFISLAPQGIVGLLQKLKTRIRAGGRTAA